MSRIISLRAALSLALLCFVGVLPACQAGGFHIPQGDPVKGRAIFTEVSCHTCHRVQGEEFPRPVASPPVPVVLGSPLNRQSRQYLAESIIAPSHRFAHPRPLYSDPPFEYSRAEYENIRSGKLSRMGDYSELMTVRELFDLVSYLDSLQKRKPGEVASN